MAGRKDEDGKPDINQKTRYVTQEPEVDAACHRCVAFKRVSGNSQLASTVTGQCRMYAPRASGNKWASVNGEDWCMEFALPSEGSGE